MYIIKIGRAEDNEFIIPNPMVSGYHANLILNDDGSIVYQDHSSNGTMINGNLIHNMAVQLQGNEDVVFPGDIIVNVANIIQTIQQPQSAKTQCGGMGEQESQGVATGVEAVASQPAAVPVDPQQIMDGVSVNGEDGKHPFSMTFALSSFFKNYVNFSGRARRSEFWFMALWNCLFSVIFLGLTPLLGPFVLVLELIYMIVTFLPSLALAVRRLHDSGHSGASILLVFIPFGVLVLLIWYCYDSQIQENKYGKSVKY